MIRAGLAIARAEWTRHHREFASPWSGRPVLLVALLATAALLGVFANSLGSDVGAGRPVPSTALGFLASGTVALLAWRSSQLTHRRFERLNPDFLLTTVPARTAAVGLLGFVAARLLVSIALPVGGVAVGLAIGLRSPAVALTVVVASAGLATISVALGTTARLAARLLGLHLVRARFYRDLLVVFGWVPLLVGAVFVQETSASLAPLVAVLGSVPLAWFVDLALLGAGEGVLASPRRGAGALGLLVLSVPVLAAGAAVLARRIWETEPASSTGSHGSRSLVHDGWLERLPGDRLSRPVRTVARERWLMERRVPRGLLSTGYVLLFVGVVGVPALLLGGPTGVLLVVAAALGLAAGVAFGADPIGTEYRVLPMLLTTVDGRRFVGGLVLAATAVGAPLVVIVVLSLGLVSVVGVVQTVLVAAVGVAVCACTASVALAVGMGVDRFDYVPVPFFFTDVPVFAEPGLRGFLRLGAVFAIVSLVTLPAFVGNAPAVAGWAATLGVPAVATQAGSLLLTIGLATVASRRAARIAVERYRTRDLG